MEVSAKDTQPKANQSLIGVSDGPISQSATKESSISMPDGATPTDSVTTMLAPPIPSSTDVTTSTIGIKDAFLGVPEMDDLLLPDLVSSKEPSTEDIINQSINDFMELT